MSEITWHLPVETLKNFVEDTTGISVSCPSYGKWILEMIRDLEMLVNVNLTEFSLGQSVSGEADVRSFGP